jgi:hypothetical protein
LDGDFALTFVMPPQLKRYLPVLAKVPKRDQTPWYLFCEPSTRVNVPVLESTLKQVMTGKGPKYIMLGKELKSARSITQSFSEGVPYGLSTSGIAMTRSIVNAFGDSVKKKECDRDFSIDVFFELSALLRERLKVELTDHKAFCGVSSGPSSSGDCATTALPKSSVASRRHPDPLRSVLPKDLIIAVKVHRYEVPGPPQLNADCRNFKIALFSF